MMNIDDIFPGPPMTVNFTKAVIQEKSKPDLMKIMLYTAVVVLAAIAVHQLLVKEE